MQAIYRANLDDMTAKQLNELMTKHYNDVEKLRHARQSDLGKQRESLIEKLKARARHRRHGEDEDDEEDGEEEEELFAQMASVGSDSLTAEKVIINLLLSFITY